MLHKFRGFTVQGTFWGSLLAVISQVSPISAMPVPPRPSLRVLEPAYVLRVLDGNTLVVQVGPSQQVRTVRLVGISPLPLINPAWEARTGEVAVAEYNAGQFMQDAMNRQTLHMEIEPNLPVTDEIVPVYLWRGTALVNQDMLSLGHALLATPPSNTRYGPALTAAAATGKAQGRGIWNYYTEATRSLP